MNEFSVQPNFPKTSTFYLPKFKMIPICNKADSVKTEKDANSRKLLFMVLRRE